MPGPRGGSRLETRAEGVAEAEPAGHVQEGPHPWSLPVLEDWEQVHRPAGVRVGLAESCSVYKYL